jgi:hypothetical protein
MHASKGHFVLLSVGTAAFLLWLFAGLATGEGGDWAVNVWSTVPPAGSTDAMRLAQASKHEAVYAKWAVFKVGVYVAFVAIVLGHALLWPRSPNRDAASA